MATTTTSAEHFAVELDDPTVVASSVASAIADPASAASAALKAAFVAADPVLSAFVYDSATGNLTSYQENGVTITLTYNADGTVATSQRGTAAAKTYTYSGGNLAGVA